MKFRRDIERGWASSPSEFFELLGASDPGEVNTDWGTVMHGEILFDADDAIIETESRADFYIERLVVDYQLRVSVATLNTANVLGVWTGLAIVDTQMALKNAVPPTGNGFLSDNFRGNTQVKRILAVDRLKVGIYAPPETTTPANATFAQLPDMSRRLMFDLSGKFFLGKNESIVLIASKTGLGSPNDDFIPWIDGDSIAVDGFSQALLRKKRNR